MENNNKKRTAVLASACAAALLLSGTFAWNMATDQTLLNEFEESDKGIYDVELDENFDPEKPWDNKDVFVTNKGDNPVIVRVRLEEFYDLTYRDGTTYNKAEGYANGDEGSSAIFNTPTDSTLTGTNADSSTKLDDKITLIFGSDVVTMAQWKAGATNAKWVIDEDGWCYYTRALLAGETTEKLLDDVDFNKDIFDAAYDSPYNLDYRINVRLQAISADLEDFGSHLNDAQWTNVAYLDENGNEVLDNAGRVIAEDDRPDNYEITADSTITDDALALVTDISYGFATPYTTEDFRNADGSIAKTVSNADELKAAIADNDVHSILLTDNITLNDTLTIAKNKFIDLGEYTITYNGAPDSNFSRVASGKKFVIKHGNIKTTDAYLIQNQAGDVTLVGVDADTGNAPAVAMLLENGKFNMYGSTLTCNSSGILLDGLNYQAHNSKIYLNNSKIIANGGDAIVHNTYDGHKGFTNAAKNVSVVLEDSYLEASGSVYNNVNGATLYAKNTEMYAKGYDANGIGENHNYAPGDAYLENCTISATTPYYKAAPSKLVLKNCTLNGLGNMNPTSGAGRAGVGIIVRCGDVTLDNVTINTSQGLFPDDDWMYTEEDVKGMYNQDRYLNGPLGDFTAMEVLLNQYDDINLTINGGSFSSTYAGHGQNNIDLPLRSIFVYDSGASIYPADHDYNNSITISGNPTFSPDFAFADSYKNTTVTVTE